VGLGFIEDVLRFSGMEVQLLVRQLLRPFVRPF
jgi:hypothetical protein